MKSESNGIMTPLTKSRDRVHLASILTLAFTLRAGVAGLAFAAYPRTWFFTNAADLGYLAQSLASGKGLSSPFGGSTGPSAMVTPGYPLFIALIFRIFGSYSVASAAVIVALQVVFAVLTVTLIMHIANRLFGALASNIAGIFWALSLPLLWLPALFWETCLSTLLLTTAIALALDIIEKPGINLWALAGALCGLAFLVNPALIPAMMAVLAWPAFQAKPIPASQPALGLLIMLTIIAPWPIRNMRTMRAPILLRDSFGYELWQGNRAGGDGIFDESLYPLHSKAQFTEYASIGELAYMREKSNLAEAYVHAHPGVFARLTAHRVMRFWIGTGGNTIVKEVAMHAVTTLALGMLGMVMLFRRRPSLAVLLLLPLLLFPLPYYITDVKFRYRFVVDPLMTVLGSYAITELFGELKAALSASHAEPVVAGESHLEFSKADPA